MRRERRCFLSRNRCCAVICDGFGQRIVVRLALTRRTGFSRLPHGKKAAAKMVGASCCDDQKPQCGVPTKPAKPSALLDTRVVYSCRKSSTSTLRRNWFNYQYAHRTIGAGAKMIKNYAITRNSNS